MIIENENYFHKFYTKDLLLPIVLTAFSVIFLLFASNIYVALLLVPIAIVSISIYFPLATFSVVISSLFIPLLISRFFVSIPVAFLIPISFLISYRNISLKDFKHANTMGILIYFISIIPSLLNSIKVSTSLLLLLNFFTTVYIFYISLVVFDNTKKIFTIIKFFLFMVLANSAHVIFDGIINSKRAFGFGGIMFVDYVGIAIIISIVSMFLMKDFKKYIFAALLIIFSISSLITQTRTSWLTTIITIIFLALFLVKNSQKVKIKKIYLVTSIFLLIGISSIVFFYLKGVSATFEDRVTQINQLDVAFDKEGKAQNSLITRLMIWHTAYNAFRSHPLIGIGVNSFPFASGGYYAIPKFLYEDYVKGLTPHQTFIAVLAETGFLGFFGFVIMLLYFIRTTFIQFNLAKDHDEVEMSMIIFGINTYILFSMFVTDCWLWGHGAILWGLALGFAGANRNILEKKYTANLNE